MGKQLKKNTKLTQSINYAIEGLITAVKTERNMRIHISVAMLVIILCLIFGVSGSGLKDIVFAIVLVFFAELINTAIEACVDLTTTKYHPLAKKAKDVAAGAVVIVSLNAVFVGYIVFSKVLKKETNELFRLLKNSYIDTLVLIVLVVVILVFTVKAYYKRGTPLQGGMPSGHSAIAFSLWVGISYSTHSIIATILSFGIALLVAQSRIEGKIHSPLEVLAGSVLGTFVTYILLRIIF
ncbi:MAG: diacylglycerol kinase [Psychrilyobacter sp.]|nr:diacylglycerol kinase [Psychrilyobacter sp.]